MSLIDLLPSYYSESYETLELQRAFLKQVNQAGEAKEDFFRQLFVQTATWGLDAWENAYGLETDRTKPDDYRRTRIMSKMRGQGTTTVELIQNVSESFSNGEVEVTEHNEQYIFDVKFVSSIGIPPNLDDLKNAIEEIKPAHLQVNYIIRFRTHEELKPYTHEHLKAYTHETLKGGTI